MPSLPLNPSELLDTVSSLGQQRDLPVYLDLVFDATADDALIDTVISAFIEVESDAFIEQVVLADEVPEIPLPADLCVVVAGESLLIGEVAHIARSKGVPCVVVMAEGKTWFSETKESVPDEAANVVERGRGIPLDDIVALDMESASEHPLEDLADWIVGNAPAKRISMADDFPFLRHSLATSIIRSTAIENGAIGGLVFIPGADMPLITLNQAKMVLQIASLYGQTLDTDRVKEIAVVVAGAFGCRAVARELSGLVPGFGWAVKAGVGVSATIAMGYASIEWFEEGGALNGLAAALDAQSGKIGEYLDSFLADIRER